MRHILAVLLVGLIVIMTQSGSMIVIGMVPDQDADFRLPRASQLATEAVAQHAVVRSEPNAAYVPSNPRSSDVVGPRRGPVK